MTATHATDPAAPAATSTGDSSVTISTIGGTTAQHHAASSTAGGRVGGEVPHGVAGARSARAAAVETSSTAAQHRTARGIRSSHQAPEPGTGSGPPAKNHAAMTAMITGMCHR